VLTVAAQTFLGNRGGISRVCELTARVAVEFGYPLELLSVQNEGGHFQGSGFWRGYGGSRTKFVFGCAGAALSGHRILYDQLGTARTHTLISRLAAPSGVWIHGIEVWENIRRDHLRAAQNLNFMIANTNYTRERAMRKHKVFEIAHVCWLSTWEDEPPPKPAALDGPPVVLILGRLDQAAYKGHSELINAWPAVLNAVPKAKLIIAGTGPLLDHYRSLVAASNAAAHIEIVGLIPEASLADLWKRAVVFAMPSRGEGFGLTYIEAMRWGVPVIASIHDAGAEVNVNGQTGLNVDLTSPDELVDSLTAILRDRDLAARFGSAGQLRWRQHFCYSAFRKRFSVILNEFLTLRK
jgi:phosphatidylinositol alpha-1,6-mannosyltransferase